MMPGTMTFHPLQSRLGSRPAQNPAVLLEQEFLQEKASALGRLGRALEAALAALHRFDQARPADEARARQRRSALVVEAAQSLWLFVVQREACGLRDTRQLLRDYRVPIEVFSLMGASPCRQRRQAGNTVDESRGR
jgi:Family of unknown function (DUF6665)